MPKIKLWVNLLYLRHGKLNSSIDMLRTRWTIPNEVRDLADGILAPQERFQCEVADQFAISKTRQIEFAHANES